MNRNLFIFLLFSIIGVTHGLDCTQIPDSAIKNGYHVVLPLNSPAPAFLPPNFNCTYLIKVFEMQYATITLTNGLLGSNDFIIVDEGFGKRTTVTSRSSYSLTFYVFPNTTASVQVTTKSVNMYSRFLIDIDYEKMFAPYAFPLQKYEVMNYYSLRKLQVPNYYNPQTLYSKEPIHLSLAQANWPATIFDNYFVIDGDFNTPVSIHRLSEFVDASFVTTTNNITLLGLDKTVLDFAIVLNPLSEAVKFDALRAESSLKAIHRVTIDAMNSKKAVEFVSVNSNQITLTSIGFSNYFPNRTAKIVTGPPNSYSELVLDMVNDEYIQPFPIPLRYFTLILENCSLTFSLWSPS
ncbi:unnamed protein product [Caenorhabditis sp. 36 PRJEB53466]|nr:unnamed protein product [Caenorhabditis sp. 36 PRJEB53466]